MPGTLFIYSVISLTIHTLFFLGMFACWVFFLPELGKLLLHLGKMFFLLGRGRVPGGIRTRGCRTAAQHANHLAMLHPTITIKCRTLAWIFRLVPFAFLWQLFCSDFSPIYSLVLEQLLLLPNNSRQSWMTFNIALDISCSSARCFVSETTVVVLFVFVCRYSSYQ